MSDVLTPAVTTAAPAAPTRSGGSLADGFLRSLERDADAPAVVVDGEELTYAGLAHHAFRLAATLQRELPLADPPHTAVLAARSRTAYAGILAALLRGHAYVPLNPRFPSDRTRDMLVRSEASALVVDAAATALLPEVLTGVERPLVVVLPDARGAAALHARWPRHRFLTADDLGDGAGFAPRAAPAPATAYLMFTSGSTGRPKAVQVLQRNVRHYLDVTVPRWGVGRGDRLSQTFDLTFDLSVSDLFVAWEAGACVCCPTPQEVLSPASFIRDARLSVWYAVPSLGLLMKRLGQLRPGVYPDLRLVLFCGEALPDELARAWSEAAPNAVVENVYGPTEATISTTWYRVARAAVPAARELGIVPIGEPHPSMEVLVVDEELAEVPRGGEGELLVSGPQVVAGYWRDPERTAAAFVELPGREGRWYRTGDRVRRPERPGVPISYRGRVDQQVKINGYRVELGEVEDALRQATGVDEVVALAWPKTESGYGGVVAFVRGAAVDSAGVRATLARRLPDYMVPRSIRAIPEIPLNGNGKFDRPALLALLQSGA